MVRWKEAVEMMECTECRFGWSEFRVRSRAYPDQLTANTQDKAADKSGAIITAAIAGTVSDSLPRLA